MAWDKNHKQQTREKILHSAARLFTTKGFDAVGINDVMKAAGLTRGAFYAHFSSKSELYGEALMSAALLARDGIRTSLPEWINDSACKSAVNSEVAARYLSQDHRRGAIDSCPLAFLTSDIHHRDDKVRDVYTKIFQGFVKSLDSGDKNNTEASMQSAVLMIGGLAIARALNDDTLSEQLLQACRAGVDKD